MAKNLNLRLSGRADVFMAVLKNEGLSDLEIIGRALELYRHAWMNGKRLAILDENDEIQTVINIDPNANFTPGQSVIEKIKGDLRSRRRTAKPVETEPLEDTRADSPLDLLAMRALAKKEIEKKANDNPNQNLNE